MALLPLLSQQLMFTSLRLSIRANVWKDKFLLWLHGQTRWWEMWLHIPWLHMLHTYTANTISAFWGLSLNEKQKQKSRWNAERRYTPPLGSLVTCMTAAPGGSADIQHLSNAINIVSKGGEKRHPPKWKPYIEFGIKQPRHEVWFLMSGQCYNNNNNNYNNKKHKSDKYVSLKWDFPIWIFTSSLFDWDLFSSFYFLCFCIMLRLNWLHLCVQTGKKNTVTKSRLNHTQHHRLLSPLCETENNQNVARGTTEQSPAYFVITAHIYLENETPLERLMCVILSQFPTKQT